MAHNYDVYFARMVMTLGLIDRETLQRALMDHKRSGTTTGFPKHLVDNGILDRLSASRAVTELERWFVAERQRAAGVSPGAPPPVALPPTVAVAPPPVAHLAPPPPPPVAPPPPPPVAPLPAAPPRPALGSSRPTFAALPPPAPPSHRPTPASAPRPAPAASWGVVTGPPVTPPATPPAPRPAPSAPPPNLRKTASERLVPPDPALEAPAPPQPRAPSRKSSASRRALRPEDLGEAPAAPPPPAPKPVSKSSASQRAYVPADLGETPRKKPSAEGRVPATETPTGGTPRRASSSSGRQRPPSDIGANVDEALPAAGRDGKQWALFNQATKDPLARLVGRRLGRTEITKLVQTGDVVTVFDGRFGDDERGVSVKVLRPDKTKDTVSLQRFTREAQALAKIDHPNIAQVLETGTEEGVRFIAMEVGGGAPLSKLIETGGRLPPDRVVRLGRSVAMGLSAAHKAGVVHRDIRPANILRDDGGTVKLVGFGIAKDVAIPGRLTHTGQITGHPSYAAPELASGEEITGKSDVYSLGIVLYLALAGRLPFESRSVVKLVGLHMNAKPPSLLEAVPNCPPKLAALITQKLLAKDPEKRPDAMEAATLLAAKDLLEGGGTAKADAPPVDMEEELRRALATDELPEAEEELGGPACAACELPLGSKVTSLHGNQLCEKCLERVESLDLCAACLQEIDSSDAATAVFGGQIYCKPCTARVRLPCAVCRKDAPLAGLATGQTKAKGDQLVHAGCARS
jgi:hypothetical protein